MTARHRDRLAPVCRLALVLVPQKHFVGAPLRTRHRHRSA
jgi:hypothetical protein